DPVLFVIPIGFLTFADTAAALIGKAYGKRRFRTSEGHKSIEGSTAFSVTGFAITCFVLTTIGTAPWPQPVLIGALLGLMMMMSEAIAWRGLDNLVIPVAAMALLDKYLELSTPELTLRLGVLSVITLAVLWWRRATPLMGEGGIAAA